MSKTDSDRNEQQNGQRGPVAPGSQLYRLLTFVAEAVAKRIMNEDVQGSHRSDATNGCSDQS